MKQAQEMQTKMQEMQDKLAEVEIFGKRFPVKLNNNKIEIETNLSAKQFGGAEGRDYFLKWLKMEMMENC